MRGATLLIAPALVLTVVSAGCVERIAEGRVRSALIDAGVGEATSACMARRMVDRLSVPQLRKLEALQGEKRSAAEYVAAVRRVGDAEVLQVTATAAALCATGLAP